MADPVQDAVAKAKAAMDTKGGAVTGVASAAPKIGPELNPKEDNPSPRPNPGAGAPAGQPTTTLAHPAAVLEPVKGGKVYHNTHPGSTYIAKSGVVYSFDAKGELSVADAEVQKELDAIADKPGCPVYTKNYVPGQNEGQPVEEITARAAATVADLKAQAQRMVR
jgi:hypothetical protein